jgi:S-adenosylmethionine:tRNA ribosyltransferase-isomerase
MKRLEIKGINFAEVTLHVGLGTFNPIEVEDLSKHKMESEEIFIDEKNAQIINKAVEANRRVCAVGTTTMRALETSVSSNKKISAFHGWTNKFIYPPHDFGVANCMITNFHTPKSTLIMMIAAFAGRDFVMHAYEEAVKENTNSTLTETQC